MSKPKATAVILTAIPAECKAVLSHLSEIKERELPQGTIYESGKFRCPDGSFWEVAATEIGSGNLSAAVETERGIAYFRPQVLFFVGIAGGLKDVKICDVVAATKVYGYESGKDQLGFHPRPEIRQSSYRLIQRARVEARHGDWVGRWNPEAGMSPQAFVGPIAAGEKILASNQSSTAKFLRENYGDTLAVEMEGRGFLEATQAYEDLLVMVIRGISDVLDEKSKSDAAGYQDLAAQAASAFAFQLLEKLTIGDQNETGTYIVVLGGSVEKMDEHQVEVLIEKLRHLSNDPLLNLTKVEEGSVKFVLKGLRKGFEAIKDLFEQEKLSDELGTKVLNVKWEDTEIYPKTAAPQFIFTAPQGQYDQESEGLFTIWIEDCNIRLKGLLSRLEESPFQYGLWTFAYSVIDKIQIDSFDHLFNVLQNAQGHETGWPPWWMPTREAIRPYRHDNNIECWLGEEGGLRGPDHSDFWRASPQGYLYLARGYQEDGLFEPGKGIEVSLPIWRIGECLLHAERFSSKVVSGPAFVNVRVDWYGLRDRKLFTHREPDDICIPENPFARDEYVTSQGLWSLDSLRSRLSVIVETLTRPLYQNFNMLLLPKDFISNNLERMRSGKY
jgi:nucleoside phosphorylase